MDAKLAEKVGLIVSIFCAGTPTTAGTLAILKAMRIEDPGQLTSFRYRGHGWPGLATAETKDQSLINTDQLQVDSDQASGQMQTGSRQYNMSYTEAWGDILSKHGQLRCRLCPDRTGEFADISLGDPWYRNTQGDMGRSLVLVRSLTGGEIWKVLINQGYIKTEPSIWSRLPESQKSIFQGRCELFGRMLILKLGKIPYPVLKGFNLKQNWEELTVKRKVKTLIGTLRRTIQRSWTSPEHYDR
jgi:coenzyme F420 hydrogenase subunit beta